MYTILINLMDSTYNDPYDHYGQTREEMNAYLGAEDSPIKAYDKFVSILDVSGKENRHNSLYKQLEDISSELSEEECIYLRFIGHCGQLQDPSGYLIEEIEDFILKSFIPKLFLIFTEQQLFINMLGCCCSYIVLPYIKQESQKGHRCLLLYTKRKITDQYSPDKYLIDGYACDELRRFDEFVQRYDHSDDYSCWNSFEEITIGEPNG